MGNVKLQIYKDLLSQTIEERKLLPRRHRRHDVKDVVVILSSSRSGSSLVKAVLSLHSGLLMLDGEEESYYILSGNGFPFVESDAFVDPINVSFLLDCIFDELGVYCDRLLSLEAFNHRVLNRLALQLPGSIHVLSGKLYELYLKHGSRRHSYVIREVFREFLGRKFGYYDGADFVVPFVEMWKIEEPPFVLPSAREWVGDLVGKTVLFKAPQDCYRIGLFEKLFPNATVKYIHLTRGFAQTVNGLMDGWLYESGFFSHDVSLIGKKLSICGYTDERQCGDIWWNFDLPPNWETYKGASLHEVCLNQWFSAHSTILNSGVDRLQVKFEDFIGFPGRELARITDYIGVSSFELPELPSVMVTEPPRSFRWYKRRGLLLELSKRSSVRGLMGDLGYSMDPDLWI